MSFNFDVIILRWKGFSKIHKTVIILIFCLGISKLSYLFYLMIQEIRKDRKIQKQKDEIEQLKTELLETKQIYLHNAESILDINSPTKKAIFERLVNLFVYDIEINIPLEISKQFYEAFKDTLDALGNGQGKNWKFAIEKIGRLSTDPKLLSILLLIITENK